MSNSSPASVPAITLKFSRGSLAGQERTFSQAAVTVGRGEGNDVRLDPLADGKVSTQHGRLFYDSARQLWVVEDLGSTNGTFVRGMRISINAPVPPRTEITLGDAIEPGGVTFLVDYSSASPAIAATVLESRAPVTPAASAPSSASAPASSPSPASSDEPPAGFFGKMSSAYKKFWQRRELKKLLATQESQLKMTQSLNVGVFAALAKDVVSKNLLSHASLSSVNAARLISDLLNKQSATSVRLAEAQAKVAAEEKSLADWIANWTPGHDAQQKSRATEELAAAKTNLESITAALTQLLDPHHAALKSAADQLTQLAGEIKSAPASMSHDKFAGAMNALRQTLSAVDQPLAGLPEQTADHARAVERVSAAESELARLTSEVAASQAQRDQQQAQSTSAISASRQLAFAEQSASTALQTQIDAQLPDLGESAARALAAGTLPSTDLPQSAPALASLNQIDDVARSIALTQKQIAELG
jgi:pSer/pThr/pTyr-binding forkhead associated (FHA) protein